MDTDYRLGLSVCHESMYQSVTKVPSVKQYQSLIFLVIIKIIRKIIFYSIRCLSGQLLSSETWLLSTLYFVQSSVNQVK